MGYDNPSSNVYESSELISISPWKKQKTAEEDWHVTVSLRSRASLSVSSANQSAAKQRATTPFPRLVENLLETYNASRIQIQFGSASSKEFRGDAANLDEVEMGPSGVCITADLYSPSNNETEDSIKLRFEELLRRLVGDRFILAPLDSVALQRLHRHVWIRRVGKNNFRLQVVLPLEGAPVATEGIVAFQSHSISNLISSINAKELSHIFMGESETLALSHERRGFWIDLQSTCLFDSLLQNDDSSSCHLSIAQGVYYTVLSKNTEKGTNLSLTRDLLPKSVRVAPSPGVDVSMVQVTLPSNEVSASFAAPSVHETEVDDSTGRIIQFDLASDWSRPWMKLQYLERDAATAGQALPVWRLERTLQRPNGIANTGTLVTRIENNDLECAATVQVVEILPTYIQPIWKTLRVEMTPVTNDEILKQLRMEPDGTFRLEWNVELLPRASANLFLDYDPTFLSFQRFPGDPNRGMDLPPTRASFTASCRRPSSSETYLYSDPLLLMPPVPDMSMPFNVISLTCTFYAFVVGSLVNLMVRKSSDRVRYALYPEKKPKGKLSRIKEKLSNRLPFLRKRQGTEGNDSVSDAAPGESAVDADTSTQVDSSEPASSEKSTSGSNG